MSYTHDETRMVRFTVAQAAVTRAELESAAMKTWETAQKFPEGHEVRRMFVDHLRIIARAMEAIEQSFPNFSDDDDAAEHIDSAMLRDRLDD